ncbi:MAG: hydantoinase B/oxoprolinase family protein [Dehalococcoidia bacterium]
MGSQNSKIDAVLMAVLANRVDGVVREMTNTLLRSARSAVINSARDFSCAIATADGQLFACAEGLPVHIFGVHNQAAEMVRVHPDLEEGDAFLDNDPYVANSHPADHCTLVPVFLDGEHLFTAVVKAHQADIGNSIPTTYYSSAVDVYQEGGLIFPVVQVQRDYEMIDDIVRMCRRRIRVPGQWYGDFLAAVGAARIAERRLKEIGQKYGRETVKRFIRDWLDYSEARMSKAISALPACRLENTGCHDPFEPFIPDGVPIKVSIEVKPQDGRIVVDLRDNLPNLDCGLNLTEATTMACVFAGIFNSISSDVPKNSGSFRRVKVELADGCVVGRPKFPHSCSMATTNVADRLVNMMGAAFAQIEGYGVAEGATGIGVGYAVLSGRDHRYDEAPFVNQLVISVNGGPASAQADGWMTYGMPVVSGLMYRDSIEIDELKMPIRYRHLRLRGGTGGAGRYRGGLSCDLAYGPIKNPVTVIFAQDTQINAPKGVRGGRDGVHAAAWFIDRGGDMRPLANNTQIELKQGEAVLGFDSSGGGYGDPRTRNPKWVLDDVLEGWETVERARDLYGVVFKGSLDDDTLAVDEAQTAKLRGH